MSYFLLPANVVWVKVIFSQVFVCPQGGGGGSAFLFLNMFSLENLGGPKQRITNASQRFLQGSHFFYPVKFPDFSLTFP